jgi:hypothetical protein
VTGNRVVNTSPPSASSIADAIAAPTALMGAPSA